MATLTFTLATPGESVTEIQCDETAQLRAPEGKKAASDFEEGDMVCLHPDGHMPVKIATIATE